MQSSQAVRWGLIGPGVIAHTFARDIAFAGNAELHAVASRAQSNADDFAKVYAIDRAYGSYQQLYDDPDIDAIYIATPHTLHMEQTLCAIAAGKSVLCEKPFTVSVGECEKIIRAAADAPVTVVEGLWTCFLPAIKVAQSWVEQGRIGTVLQVNSSFGYPIPYHAEARAYNKMIGGGCLLDMGIYPIALNWLFTRRQPQQINTVAHYAPNGVEDDIVMLFDYGDKTASLATSFRARLPNTTSIIGTDGYIVIPDSFRASECYLYEVDTQIDNYNDQRTGSGFEYQIESVSADILAKRQQSAIMPLSNSLAFQQQIEQVRATFE